MRIVLLVLALAGCLAPALPSTLAAAETTTPRDLALQGCENLSGSFPMPAAVATAELPAGVRPRSAESSLRSVYWVVLVRCAGSEVAGVPTGEAWLAYGELDVLVPAALGVPGAGEHTVPLFTLASPAPVAEALVDMGLPRVSVATDLSRETLTEGVTVARIGAAGAGLRMTGVPTGTPTPLGSGSWGMLGVHDGAIVSRVQGSASGGVAVSSALSQAAEGDVPRAHLAAQPAARGGMVSGFDLALTRVG